VLGKEKQPVEVSHLWLLWGWRLWFARLSGCQGQFPEGQVARLGGVVAVTQAEGGHHAVAVAEPEELLHFVFVAGRNRAVVAAQELRYLFAIVVHVFLAHAHFGDPEGPVAAGFVIVVEQLPQVAKGPVRIGPVRVWALAVRVKS